MKVRIVEQTALVTETTYEVDVPPEVFHEAAGESVEDYRDEWQEVHRETLRKNIEIPSIEEVVS